jgi:N-methylhydantoinase A
MMRVTGRVAGLTQEELFDFPKTSKPVPLVPKYLVEEVDERVDYKGSVVVPLNEEQARAAIRRLLDHGVGAIAISLLWSFKNDSHERRLRELVAEMAPEVPVSVSSEIVPKIGEYERTATTVVNSYTLPLMSHYVRALEEELAKEELRAPFLIMHSAGGVMTAAEASELPVRTVNSGPAGGVIGAKFLGSALGHENIICTDVGGTSFDVGLIVDGEPLMTPTQVVDQYSLLLPSVDVVSIGAGGGSIASSAGGARLQVGPESAGARPGPACFGLGGERPTVTDADLVLGYIDPDYFLAGQIKLDKERAERAIKEHVADPLGMNVAQAAAGIVEITNAHMTDLVRKTTVERGFDPRRFVLYAYGGAGPLHATAYGRGIGAQAIVVPFGGLAPVFSAFGIAISDLVRVVEYSDPQVAPFDIQHIVGTFQRLAEEARDLLRGSGGRDEDVRFNYTAEMRYLKQVYEVSVPLELEQLENRGSDGLVEDFEQRYQQIYGKGSGFSGAGVEFISYRVTGTAAPLTKPRLERKQADEDLDAASRGERPVYWPTERDFVQTPIYEGERLRSGQQIEGPAVIEERATSIPLYAGQILTVDPYGNLTIQSEGAG